MNIHQIKKILRRHFSPPALFEKIAAPMLSLLLYTNQQPQKTENRHISLLKKYNFFDSISQKLVLWVSQFFRERSLDGICNCWHSCQPTYIPTILEWLEILEIQNFLVLVTLVAPMDLVTLWPVWWSSRCSVLFFQQYQQFISLQF